jgi:hypothetical protein
MTLEELERWGNQHPLPPNPPPCFFPVSRRVFPSPSPSRSYGVGGVPLIATLFDPQSSQTSNNTGEHQAPDLRRGRVVSARAPRFTPTLPIVTLFMASFAVPQFPCVLLTNTFGISTNHVLKVSSLATCFRQVAFVAEGGKRRAPNISVSRRQQG